MKKITTALLATLLVCNTTSATTPQQNTAKDKLLKVAALVVRKAAIGSATMLIAHSLCRTILVYRFPARAQAFPYDPISHLIHGACFGGAFGLVTGVTELFESSANTNKKL
jgi:hypothetical protein